MALKSEIALTQLVMQRLDAQDEQIAAALAMVEERGRQVHELLERLEGAACVFRDSVREMRREW